MLSFRNHSLRRKQTLIMMLTSSIVLLLACATFVTFDAVTCRRELAESVSVLAEAIGNNCAAAIDFNDPKTAGETLAELRADDNIVSACVYSRDGQVFAVYQRAGASPLVPPDQAGHRPGIHGRPTAPVSSRPTARRGVRWAKGNQGPSPDISHAA